MASQKLPEFVLFGDSLTQWSFYESNQGCGWFLMGKYANKIRIVNEGNNHSYRHLSYTSDTLKANFREIIKRATTPTEAPTLLFTIWVGANDACFVGSREYVPLPAFEENIRLYVDTILSETSMANTNIVLLTPPPINIPDTRYDDGGVDIGPAGAVERDPKQERGYRTYMSKKRYAEKVMEIAGSYDDTGRVAGLHLWRAFVDAALADQNRLGDEDAYTEDRLPGCGLKGAKQFKQGYFDDGLHLDALGYNLVSTALLEVVLGKWPELAPERIQTSTQI
ncbi:SGNH hydrolase-type esterase domain-containing protein [Massariosphaeria phaeospora]|uniref:SGNH hydrolase-type esterase domain-containing protein n=1 Tax=Massariosphaeria phaeospora TaxID=100035 RepID=A0A7C8I8M4_9PLEO|nr:SGNH hydrolase-type esterase domain-containing protein [Massariosphaeria phaeospora]